MPYGGGTYSWEQSTRTLTLNNVTHTSESWLGMNFLDGVTIVLNGENSIETLYPKTSEFSNAIRVGNVTSGPTYKYADMVITSYSGGSLTVKNGPGTSTKAIEVYGNLTISGNATVYAMADAATGDGTQGIYARKSITITDDAIVTARGGRGSGDKSASSGIRAETGDIIISGNAKVTASADIVITYKEGISSGIRSSEGNISISGNAQVTATGKSYGIHAIGGFSISGGTLTAIGDSRAIFIGSAADYSYTVPAGYRYFVNGSTTPSGDPLTGDGTTTKITTQKYAKIAIGDPPKITTADGPLHVARVGNDYDITLEATGALPIKWTIVGGPSGSLPAGLKLSENGIISGQPAAVCGEFSFKVKAENSIGYDTANFSIVVGSDLSFTVVQTGGVLDKADTKGIAIEFSEEVSGLTADNITITDGTGAATKGALTGSGKTWTIALSNVSKQGNIIIGVTDFSTFYIITPPRFVQIYKDDNPSLTALEFKVWNPGGSHTNEIGIEFTEAIGGLTAKDVTVENGTGVITGKLLFCENPSNSKFWYIHILHIKSAGEVTVSISDFGKYKIITPPQTIEVFKDESYHSVYVKDSYDSSDSGESDYAPGATVGIAAGTRKGYEFAGWKVNSGGVELADASNAYTTFIMPSNDVTVTAEWKKGEEELDFPFTDIPEGIWYSGAVKIAFQMHLIDGTTATTFSPNNNLTYAQALKLAACMHQSYMTGEVTLEKAAGAAWYTPYESYAINNGIISAEHDYNWNAPATRAGYMELFSRALPDEALPAINSIADNAIPDVKMTHRNASAIYKLYRAGIVTGMDTATHRCSPDSNILRSQVATILVRMMLPAEREEFDM